MRIETLSGYTIREHILDDRTGTETMTRTERTTARRTTAGRQIRRKRPTASATTGHEPRRDRTDSGQRKRHEKENRRPPSRKLRGKPVTSRDKKRSPGIRRSELPVPAQKQRYRHTDRKAHADNGSDRRSGHNRIRPEWLLRQFTIQLPVTVSYAYCLRRGQVRYGYPRCPSRTRAIPHGDHAPEFRPYLTFTDTPRSLRLPLVPASLRYGELPEYTRAAKSCSKTSKQ